MRKALIPVCLLAVALLLPLGLMKSERSLLVLAHWAVETFTEFRLVLRKPVIRPFDGVISASEIHLYPIAEDAPPFLSILNFSGDLNVADLYWANLDESQLAADQVTIYISSNDDTSDPAPLEWLQYLGWLPERLDVGQLHVITASNKTLIFPLGDISGHRPEHNRFLATAQAVYDGEPLSLSIDIATLIEREKHTGVTLKSSFFAPESDSRVSLDGELRGTLDDFNYDFKLDADYQDVARFLQGFNVDRNIAGQLTLRAQMHGNTAGFTLSDAVFILDNMPEYGLEAHGTLDYDLTTGNRLKLVTSVEVSSLDAVISWADVDLRPLGKALGHATVAGTLDHPVIENFILRSESEKGLVVNLQGKVDPRVSIGEDNEVRVDIHGPDLSTLSEWTGPIPHDPGPFSISGLLVGARERLRVENFVAEVGSAENLLLRAEGEADVGDFAAQQLSALKQADLEIVISSPNSEFLAPYVAAGVPSGFGIRGEIAVSGNIDELKITSGLLSANSSDIRLDITPTAGTIRLQDEAPLSGFRGDVSAYLSDTSALSQFFTAPIPVLGEVNGTAKAVQHAAKISLEEIRIDLDAEGPSLQSTGRIDDVTQLRGLELQARFAGLEARDLLTTALQELTYAGNLGQLEGSFKLDNSEQNWSLRDFRATSTDENQPLNLDFQADLLDLTGLPSADMSVRYKLRDPNLMQAITGLRMNPSEGEITLNSRQGITAASGTVRFGETPISARAQLAHSSWELDKLTLEVESPLVQLEDIGLQAEKGKNSEYRPADQLDELEPNQRFEKALQQAPSFETDITINFDGISGDHTNIESFHLHFTGLDQRYTLRRLSIAYDQSMSEVRGIIDLNAKPAFASLAGEALAIPLDTLSRDLGLDFDVSGIANVRGGITSQGTSATSLLASLDGSLAVALEKAVIEGAAYDVLATDLLAWFYSGAAMEESTRINCAMAHFDLDDGVAESDSLYIETRKMVATGTAELDLGARKLDVSFTPRSKSRSLQVPSSIRLKGDFDDPKVVISPIAAAFDAYAEVLSLVPQMARKIFGSGRRKKDERPCVPGS